MREGMQAINPVGDGSLQGLVASRIATYGGRHGASAQSAAGSLYPRGGTGAGPDPSRRRLQDYVPFAKSSGQARRPSPLKLREPESEKWHGEHLGASPPYSPKLKGVVTVEHLKRRLRTFSMFGIPRLPPEDRRHWELGEASDRSLVIEKSWRELVPGHKEMTQELCHQQEALWELLTTEVIYVGKLKVMTDLIAAGLLNLQRVGVLIDVSAETLFGNVPSLIRAHRSFWEEVLGPTLKETRASGQPLDPVGLQNGFLSFGQRFQPYVQYCLHVKQTMAYAREQQDSNPLFQLFVQWCEKHKLSGRQTLGDLLIKPHQRITKYPLLLHAVLKRSPEARAREALKAMIAAVESFLRHINGQVRQGEEHASLAAAVQRIGPYEVLDPSSDEMEKVREDKALGPSEAQEMGGDTEGAWAPPRRGGPGSSGCEGPRDIVQENKKVLGHSVSLQEGKSGEEGPGVEQPATLGGILRTRPAHPLKPLLGAPQHLRPFSTLDLTAPMVGVAPEHTRQLLLEGSVRMKEGREGKLDVHLFLFSDVLLVTKPQRKADKAKVIRPPLMLENLVCRPLRDPNSFLVISLTDFQCVSSALIVHCPSSTDCARWLEKTHQAQAALQKLKAEEYVRQKRELLALYRDQESPSPRPSTPSLEGSQSSTKGRIPEFSAVVPHLVVTEDTDEDTPSVPPEDASDSGYGTLIPASPKEPHSPLSRLRQRALRRDPRLTFSTLDLREVPLRPQNPDFQAPHRRSAPELPGDSIRRGSSLPRGDPPSWSEEEDGTPEGGNVVVETLHRAQIRDQLPRPPSHVDSAGESPWDSSADEEEEKTPSLKHFRAENMLRKLREDLASQRIEGSPEPRRSQPRKLTLAQLQKMRASHIIQLDTPTSTSEV